jgi:dolichol kinase
MIPLWLLPQTTNPSKLSLSSGVLAVGVGDAAAAILGTIYGRTQLGLRSGKTWEGLIGNILAMVAFKLVWVGYLGFVSEFSFIMAAIITAFVEAISCNCDNLVLPLVMIISLELL